VVAINQIFPRVLAAKVKIFVIGFKKVKSICMNHFFRKTTPKIALSVQSIEAYVIP